MRIFALLNLLSKVSIGKKSLKRSIMNLLKLHSEAEGAGVGKASGSTKKELPNHLGNSSHCVSSGVFSVVSGGVLQVIDTFHNTLQSSIFADSFIQAIKAVGRKPRHVR